MGQNRSIRDVVLNMSIKQLSFSFFIMILIIRQYVRPETSAKYYKDMT